MRRSDFRDLQVWHKSYHLSLDLYKVTMSYPDTEKFGMTNQIRRASLSVPCNIAEGHGRGSNADFVRFLFMALGSIRELETLMEMSSDLDYIEDASPYVERLQEIAKMVTALIDNRRGYSKA